MEKESTKTDEYTALSDDISKGFDGQLDSMLWMAMYGIVYEMVRHSGKPYSVKKYNSVINSIDTSKIGAIIDEKTLKYAQELAKEIIGG